MIPSKSNLPKQIVILTKSNLLANSIKDNLPTVEILSDNKGSIDSYSRIDLLIIDSDDIESETIQQYKVKTAVNLINRRNFLEDEIKISKPFRLNNLLRIIEN